MINCRDCIYCDTSLIVSFSLTGGVEIGKDECSHPAEYQAGDGVMECKGYEHDTEG